MAQQTLAEQALIAELEGERARLLADESARGLLQVIRRRLRTTTNNLYLVRCIPEQRENLYDVLVDGASVAHIEIRRGEVQETVFELSSVEAYQRRAMSLTKTDRRKLEVALQLARAR